VTSDIYADWLPKNFYYFFHLIAWMGPIVALQWAIGWKIFLANLRPIFMPVLLVGTYLIATDIVAVKLGIWFFDPNLILSGSIDPNQSPVAHFLLQPFGVPLEEWLFFYLTALLCSQSFVLFLPERYRHSQR
jgi:lycopene cyclase domain-containing protein